MAVSFTWSVPGSTPTTVGETDVIRLAGETFTDRIEVGEYNDGTYVRNSGGTETSSGNTPNNVKFISQDDGTGGDSQADWGDGTEDIDQISAGENNLRIVISDSGNFSTEDFEFYSYGANPSTAIVGVTTKAAEVGDANFTDANSSASALQLADQSTPATSHTFDILLSMSGSSYGTKSGTLFIGGTIY